MALITQVLLLGLAAFAAAQSSMKFPNGFIFGAATASYQVEGAWNADGKGESIWDNMVHTHPEYVVDGTNGDLADNSYYMYKEDVKLLKELGMDFYRFSISWPRIMPTGEANNINAAGIQYYNNLINELLANGIQPMVSMFHWDLPQWLEDMGGWMNPLMINYFEDYARVLFTNFGDRVKWWNTFNEPASIISGYASTWSKAPSKFKHGVGDYYATHHIMLAHARAYHMYDDEFRATQKGKISMALSTAWEEPLTTSAEDAAAAERCLQYTIGMFAHPIYKGDYPPIVRERTDANSKAEGRTRSRLPYFSDWEINYIKGTSDYFAMNYYTAHYATSGLQGDDPSMWRDGGVIESFDENWPTSASYWLKVVPWGFRKMINWVNKEYSPASIVITENGYSDHGILEDNARTSYYWNHLAELLKAIHDDGINVVGFTAWTLMDNFEWNAGYSERFGLYYVNISDPARTRTPKSSATFFQELLRTRTLT